MADAKRIELTSDAIDVAKAFMDLCGADRTAFKRAIEVRWLITQCTSQPPRVKDVRAVYDNVDN